MAFVLVLHKLILEKRWQVLEAVAFDPWQVQDWRVVNAPHCGSAAASEKVADLAKDTSSLYFADIVFSTCKVSASDSALAFGQKVEGGGGTPLADHYVFRQLLQWLTHGTNELQLTLKYRVGLDRFTEQLTFLAKDLE